MKAFRFPHEAWRTKKDKRIYLWWFPSVLGSCCPLPDWSTRRIYWNETMKRKRWTFEAFPSWWEKKNCFNEQLQQQQHQQWCLCSRRVRGRIGVTLKAKKSFLTAHELWRNVAYLGVRARNRSNKAFHHCKFKLNTSRLLNTFSTR